MPVKLDPIKITITSGSTTEQQLKRYLKNRIRSIKDGLKEWHETKIPEYRRRYDAKPLKESRDFPFENASNLVVPIVAIHTDTLLARVMNAVIKTKPIWTTRLVGAFLNAANDETSPQELKDLIEEHLQYEALDPQLLDLYRVYHEWFGEAIKIGYSILKCPQYEEVEDMVVPAGDGSGKFEYEKRTIYSGPRPEKLPIEDFGLPVHSKTVESADFKYHRKRLQKWELEERAFKNTYDKAAVASILNKPDRTSPDRVQQQKETDANLKTISTDGEVWSEWDIYECYFRYRVDDKHNTRCIVWYHLATDTILRAFYDYYPENIFIGARLFYRDDLFPGYGFAETLGMLQEEDSQIHNNRRDNQTVANARVWRVNSDSPLHQGFKIYPSAMIPADKDEIEPMAHGELSEVNIEEERLVLDLAERRSGVSPPQQGAGAGTNTKRGVYTAMGTLSVIQEGNTRTDLNITDIRYAHQKVGRLLGVHYATFGVDDAQLEVFGQKAEKILEAYEKMRDKKIVIPLYSSSASVNREIEKQNDLMLTNIMNKHYSGIAQMLQASNNQFSSEGEKQYSKDAIKASNRLMQSVLRHFGYDEVEQFVPAPKPTPQPAQGVPGAPGAGAPTATGPGPAQLPTGAAGLPSLPGGSSTPGAIQ